MPDDVIADTSPNSLLAASAATSIRALILHHDLVLGEYAEEVLIINSSRLVSPEVVNESIKLIFIESEIDVLEHVFEVISANVASIMLVNHLEETTHRHVCLLHSLR